MSPAIPLVIRAVYCIESHARPKITWAKSHPITQRGSNTYLAAVIWRWTEQKGLNLFLFIADAHTCGMEEQSTDYMWFIFSCLKGKPLVPCAVTPQRTLFPLAVCLLKQRSRSVTHHQRALDAAEIPKKGKVAFIRFFLSDIALGVFLGGGF